MIFPAKIWYFFIFQCALCAVDNVTYLKIAGIFENIQLHQEAFKYSQRISSLKSTPNNVIVSPVIDPYVLKDEPFTAYKATCSFLRQSVVGIFGPQSALNFDIVQAITDRKDIPHILTRWIRPSEMRLQTFNFFPNPDRLADGFVDIINALEWETFTVLYTNEEHLIRSNEFIRKAKDDGIIVYIENIDPFGDGNYRPVLRNAGRSGQKNFVLDCPIQDLRTLLTQLQQVGLLTAEYNYFLTNMDAHTEDLSQFQYSDAVITGVHLIKAKDELALRASQDLCMLYNITFKLDCGKPELDIETALIIDSVNVFLQTLNSLGIVEGQYLDCDGEGGWTDGLSVINALRTGSFEGITGQIEFDNHGFRRTFQLTIYQIRDNTTIRGSWNSTDGLSEDIELTYSDEKEEEDSDLKNKELTVLITLTEPYARLSPTDGEVLKGNGRFEGFAIDLIEEIANMEGFDYTLVVRSDHNHGNFDRKTGKWDGMIGDIIDGRADLAIADLTINKERVDPIEFTLPFMSVGISILFHKPTVIPPPFFHFAQPFSIRFWEYLAGSYLITVLSLFLIGRLSPSEWQRPHTCKEDKKYLVNELTLLNSFWFAAAGLFRQPTNVKINSVAAKVIAGAWYIYCFVLFAMYISYSFANNHVEEKEEMFGNVEEFLRYAEENSIGFGAMKNGATEGFFKNSKSEVYQEVAKYMEENPNDMMATTTDGIQRVLEGNYAFFMESATIAYTVRRHCNLTSYGGLLDSKGFGIAVKKGSNLLGPLNRAIIKLQSSGELQRLKNVWWNEKYAGDPCDAEDDSVPLDKTVPHVNGLIAITFLGIAIAFVSSVLEFTVYAIRLSRKVKAPFGETFGEELKKCFGKSHTVQHVEEIALTKPENGDSAVKENA
ncbi:unnamed protein product [Phyllotreta striolata]|uniref:Glutamate receptor ionotropic, kainate 2 n=1 Tax=Phyllotreta striolata TaxID=444603 RepID=A0A9N9TUE0_PHYSR|nr:unnamed protein product [Phyllotreta striolata]